MKTKYLIILKQKGYGCDYTIGCGITYDEIEANGELEIFKYVEQNWGTDDIEEVMYVPLNGVKNLDLEEFNVEYKKYLEYKRRFEGFDDDDL